MNIYNKQYEKLDLQEGGTAKHFQISCLNSHNDH